MELSNAMGSNLSRVVYYLLEEKFLNKRCCINADYAFSCLVIIISHVMDRLGVITREENENLVSFNVAVS